MKTNKPLAEDQAAPRQSPPGDAVLLIAHGSRRAEANADLERLAELLSKEQPESIVEVSFLEIALPDIPTGAARCVQRGARVVKMLPYFLSAGAHVVEDLQRFRDELAQQFSDVSFIVCPHLGLHPLMVEIVRQRLAEGSDSSHDRV